MKRALQTRMLVAAFLLLLPLLARAEPRFTGKVVGVYDGDTLSVLLDTSKGKWAARVRLHGIDCPESAQPFGARAKQFTSQMAFGKTVTIDVKDTDQYGRAVCIVTVGGKILNHELLKAGLAWWYRQYAPGDKTLSKLEAEAKAAKRGLWADKAPVPPWAWRKGGQEPRDGGETVLHRDAPEEGVRGETSPPADTGATVYITRTGRKFHKDGCQGLARSRIPITRKDAEARGYGPCGLCRP